jgi:hypothetical protein
VQISNGQLNWSSIGLNGFFVISGYFIFQSLIEAPIELYFKKDPSCLSWIVNALSTVVIIPFVYTGAHSIFTQKIITPIYPITLVYLVFNLLSVAF